MHDNEDLAELIPQEVRRTLAQIAEIDVSLEKDVEALGKQVQNLFSGCLREEIDKPEADREFNAIRSNYSNALEDADSKIKLAENLSDLAQNYAQELDRKLAQMKYELTSSDRGITEVLENRVYDLEDSLNQYENFYLSSVSNDRSRSRPEAKAIFEPRQHGRRRVTPKATRTGSTSAHNLLGRGDSPAAANVFKTQKKPKKKLASSKANVKNNTVGFDNRSKEKRRDSDLVFGTPTEKRQAVTNTITSKPVPAKRNTAPHLSPPATPNHSVASYSGVGDGISVAARQTIAAPQQLQRSGPKSILKATNNGTRKTKAINVLGSVGLVAAAGVYKTDNANANGGNTAVAKAAPQTNMKNIPASIGSRQRNSPPNRKWMAFQKRQRDSSSSSCETEIAINVDQSSDEAWTYNPNEPKYCVCNQTSYGDMVACDNEECPIEWFHYPCVGITAAPKGKWYCPKCAALMSRNIWKSNNVKKQ